ncbi:hypothetical protein BKN38_03730 [Helicobacter sp. CLO-3]|uniref:AraC family transcriptional regulator n=1 Tax=unclassified Helicobacter TaxID=2593540 RepID=UPI000804B960|nr:MULTISPECIES: AraC family transcriptional regulator [unclassified Helicobacter]OBV29254.1 hypothetical protein BA723_06295 [Helicobacter sp. CLO-3]OHU84146.1 hypothetical protein BKN38_03730 [Helicobacter sp. CLO-3]
MLYLPNDLGFFPNSSEQNLQIHTLGRCTFARYQQRDSTRHLPVCMQEHVLIFVRNGEKIFHNGAQELHLKKGECTLIRAGSYTISNITARGLYEAYLFFFNAPLLTALAHKHKDLLPANILNPRENPHKSSNENPRKLRESLCENLQGKMADSKAADKTPDSIKSLASDDSGKITDPALQNIIEGFSAHFECNTRYLEPMIELKFEELFLHLALSGNKAFLGFIRELFATTRLGLGELFAYCEREFLSVADMAKFARLDNASFWREFKQYFNISPKKWLDEKRLLKARFLLQYADKNVSEICSDCGFSSPAWFIARFKEQFNQTPKQYQKALQRI